MEKEPNLTEDKGLNALGGDQVARGRGRVWEGDSDSVEEGSTQMN